MLGDKTMRVYIDTSVIGGCLDDEFRKWSLRLIKEFAAGDKTPVISDVTMRELARAPAAVRAVLDPIPESSLERVVLDDEARHLAHAYSADKVVAPDDARDAQHIAIATIARVDVLVSWNFKHIVNYRRIRLYNSVNLRQGYGIIDIRSPREVLDEKDL